MRKKRNKRIPSLFLVLIMMVSFVLNFPMTASATTVSTLGSGFSNPQGVAVDSSGNIYVADYSNNVIKKMDSSGNNIVTLSSSFLNPHGVVVDSSGNVYVADNGHNTITKMDSSGNHIITLGSGFLGPQGVAVGISGNIYVADTGHSAIKKMDSSGNNIVTLGSGFSYPYGVAVDSNGNVYVADYGHSTITKMDSSGNNIVNLGSGFSFPGGGGVAVDSSGNVYVADKGNSAIKKMDSNGNNIVTMGSGFSNPFGVALDSSSNIYVADSGNSAIKKIVTAATYTVTYNGNGSTGGSIPTDGNSYDNNASVTVAGNTGNLAKTGFTFAGWNTAANGGGTDYAAGVTFNITANTTLYAKWTGNSSYTVGYNGNGNTNGSVPDCGTYAQGATVTVVGNTGNLTRIGSTFAGWNTAADGSGIDYATGATFAVGISDVTLYAKWTENPMIPALTVVAGQSFTLVMAGGDSIADGASSGGVTVTNSNANDGYIILSGTLNSVGVQVISIDGHYFVLNKIAPPTNSTVTATFN